MKYLEKELAASLIVIACPWGHGRGYLGKLLPAALYIASYGASYTPPDAAPPPYPIIPPGATIAIREELRANNEEAQNNWQTMLHVRRIAFNIATEAIDNVYYSELEDPIEGLDGVEIRNLIEHIRDCYCHIVQADLDANLDCFQQGIDPSLPLIVYIHKQEDCQEFTHDGHVNISKATLVTRGINMPSNAAPSPTYGKNGTVLLASTKLG